MPAQSPRAPARLQLSPENPYRLEAATDVGMSKIFKKLIGSKTTSSKSAQSQAVVSHSSGHHEVSEELSDYAKHIDKQKNLHKEAQATFKAESHARDNKLHAADQAYHEAHNAEAAQKKHQIEFDKASAALADSEAKKHIAMQKLKKHKEDAQIEHPSGPGQGGVNTSYHLTNNHYQTSQNNPHAIEPHNTHAFQNAAALRSITDGESHDISFDTGTLPASYHDNTSQNAQIPPRTYYPSVQTWSPGTQLSNANFIGPRAR